MKGRLLYTVYPELITTAEDCLRLGLSMSNFLFRSPRMT